MVFNIFENHHMDISIRKNLQTKGVWQEVKHKNEFQITVTEHELIDLFRSLNAFEQGQLFERAKSLSNNKKIADINKENKNCL